MKLNYGKGFNCFLSLFLLAFLVLPSVSLAGTDILDKIEIQKSRLRYDRRAKTSSLNVSIKNISEDVLSAPIKIVIDNISNSTVTVNNADGDYYGKPYFEYSGLAPNQTSSLKNWIFDNPNRARFNYSTKVIGTVEDPTPIDSDDDGVPDGQDNCPNTSNPEQSDVDDNGIGDACDAPQDSDGDGTPDDQDSCPNDQNKTIPGDCGCDVIDTDSDNDGTADCNDNCSNDPTKTEPGVCGCGIADTDSDRDAIPDCNDNCPGDPGKNEPGICGCEIEDTDSDNDGIVDCNETCLNTPNGETVDSYGCSDSQKDSDNDGISDALDQCPGNDDHVDVDSDGISDGCDEIIDTDHDGITNENDLCPATPDGMNVSEYGCQIIENKEIKIVQSGQVESILIEGVNTKIVMRQLLVHCKLDISEEEKSDLYEILDSLNCGIIGTVPTLKMYQIVLPQDFSYDFIINTLEELSYIQFVYYNTIPKLQIESYPQPTEHGWVIDNNGSTVGTWPNENTYWIDRLNLNDAWEISKNIEQSSRVGTEAIGIVDSGFAFDLKLTPQKSEGKVVNVYDVNGDVIDPYLFSDELRHSTTYKGDDVCSGEDYSEGEVLYRKTPAYHGTMVSTFASSNGGDEVLGGVGVSWDNSLYFVDVDKTAVEEPISHWVAGCDTLLSLNNNQCRIINISAGGGDTKESRQKWRYQFDNAVKTASIRGKMIIFPAGNPAQDGSNINDDNIIYENADISWDTNVLIVGGTDTNNNRYGTIGKVIDTFAPAKEIGQPLYDDEICDFKRSLEYTVDGTSFSAPMVAGAVSLIWSIRPELEPSQIINILKQTNDDSIFENWDDLLKQNIDDHAGLMDIAKALEEAAFYDLKLNVHDDVISGTTYQLTWNIQEYAGDCDGCNAYIIRESSDPDDFVLDPNDPSNKIIWSKNITTQSFTQTVEEDTTYYYQVTAYNDRAGISKTSNIISVTVKPPLFFRDYLWRVASGSEHQGLLSYHRIENVNYDKNNDEVQLTHKVDGEKYFGANIETYRGDFGYGEFTAKLTLPQKTDKGIVAAFFLYYENKDTGEVDEVDFEFLPGLDGVQVGTYNNWIKQDHNTDVDDGKKTGIRDHELIAREKEDGDTYWEWGTEISLTIKKQIDATIFIIEKDGNREEIWRTGSDLDYGFKAPVDAEQYVMFNLWTPDTDWPVGGNPTTVPEINMYVNYFEFKPDTDGDGVLDEDIGLQDTDSDGIINDEDNCIDTPNEDQNDWDNDELGDVCDDDDDNDGIKDNEDDFPYDPSENKDSDNDSYGDNSDNCPSIFNPDQADADSDGIGNSCDQNSIYNRDLLVEPVPGLKTEENIVSPNGNITLSASFKNAGSESETILVNWYLKDPEGNLTQSETTSYNDIKGGTSTGKQSIPIQVGTQNGQWTAIVSIDTQFDDNTENNQASVSFYVGENQIFPTYKRYLHYLFEGMAPSSVVIEDEYKIELVSVSSDYARFKINESSPFTVDEGEFYSAVGGNVVITQVSPEVNAGIIPGTNPPEYYDDCSFSSWVAPVPTDTINATKTNASCYPGEEFNYTFSVPSNSMPDNVRVNSDGNDSALIKDYSDDWDFDRLENGKFELRGIINNDIPTYGEFKFWIIFTLSSEKYAQILTVNVLKPAVDSDGDGIDDDQDAFPDNPNEWVDFDEDGLGDNSEDLCPDTLLNEPFDSNGCSYSQRDDDNDGSSNALDAFPNDPQKWLSNPVPDTGQTKCYGMNSEIDCPEKGEAFYNQDATKNIFRPDYTKLDANGNELTNDAAQWSMVLDNHTGLIWEVKTGEPGINNKDNRYNWQNAKTDFISQLNEQKYGGFSDWRLPDIKELTNIVNYGTFNPSISLDYFPNTQSGIYWSNDMSIFNENNVWNVYFNYGRVYRSSKYNSQYVRAVRGGRDRFIKRFIVKPDNTVIDPNTGLMWQQSSSETAMDWKSALAYCDELILGGHKDWRLPTIKEMHSIVNYKVFDPSIDTQTFPNTKAAHYWSSTTGSTNKFDGYYSVGAAAWELYFRAGYNSHHIKNLNYYVRAVRNITPNELNYEIKWVDSDHDGLNDNFDDHCLDTPPNEEADLTGCSYSQRDDDGDGVNNGSDLFPDDPSEWADSDNDGFGDNADLCPTTRGDNNVYSFGCEFPYIDYFVKEGACNNQCCTQTTTKQLPETDFSIKGDKAFVLSASVLSVIDISDPNNPQIMTKIKCEPSQPYNKMSLTDDFLYLYFHKKTQMYNDSGKIYASVQILNISNPNELKIEKTIDFSAYGDDIILSGPFVYIFEHDMNRDWWQIPHSIRSVDLRNPITISENDLKFCAIYHASERMPKFDNDGCKTLPWNNNSILKSASPLGERLVLTYIHQTQVSLFDQVKIIEISPFGDITTPQDITGPGPDFLKSNEIISDPRSEPGFTNCNYIENGTYPFYDREVIRNNSNSRYVITPLLVSEPAEDPGSWVSTLVNMINRYQTEGPIQSFFPIGLPTLVRIPGMEWNWHWYKPNLYLPADFEIIGDYAVIIGIGYGSYYDSGSQIIVQNLNTLQIEMIDHIPEIVSQIEKSGNKIYALTDKGLKIYDLPVTENPSEPFYSESEDFDLDGVLNTLDNCLYIGNPDQSDVNEDGIGDICTETGLCLLVAPIDSDGDGVGDDVDLCPDTEPWIPWSQVNSYGCDGDLDFDGDGVIDDWDMCPETLPGQIVDEYGCAAGGEYDSDSDGVSDDYDMCPNTQPGMPVEPDGCPGQMDIAVDLFSQALSGTGCSEVMSENIVVNSIELHNDVETYPLDLFWNPITIPFDQYLVRVEMQQTNDSSIPAHTYVLSISDYISGQVNNLELIGNQVNGSNINLGVFYSPESNLIQLFLTPDLNYCDGQSPYQP